MTPTAKSALVLAAVGAVALILAWTDALAPASAPTSTTVPTTTAAATPATSTTTTVEPETLEPPYLRDMDDDTLIAPQGPSGVAPCTESALRGSLASVVVTRSNPEQRRLIVRVTNDSATPCAIEVGLDLGFAAATDGDDARLAARRVNPPPGMTARFSYRDPVLEPGTSARFSIVATAVEFVGDDEEVSAVSIGGRAGELARTDLPGMRVVAATDWYGPIPGRGTGLDPSSFLVPLPPAGTPACDAASTLARTTVDAQPTGTNETSLLVTNESAAACALPADLVMQHTGTDAAEPSTVARVAPSAGTYIAPVIPAAGRIRLVVVGTSAPSGTADDQAGDLALRFPNGEDVIVDRGDPSFLPAIGWYGPIETPAGDD